MNKKNSNDFNFIKMSINSQKQYILKESKEKMTL